MASAIGCGASQAAKSSGHGAEAAEERPIPPDLRESVARAAAIGRQLYVLDKVAALGTDVVFANVEDPRVDGVVGYLPMQEGDAAGELLESFVVSFYTREEPPRIVYEVRIAPEVRPAFQRFSPPKETTEEFVALVRARQLALAALPTVHQPLNPVLLPGEANGESGTLVYLLAGTTKPNVAVLGQHFRALVSHDGSSVVYLMPLSRTILEFPTRTPEGQQVVALAVTHVVTDFPLETHVFTSLLTRLPVYVGTKRGSWRVSGDEIAFLGQNGPAEAR